MQRASSNKSVYKTPRITKRKTNHKKGKLTKGLYTQNSQKTPKRMIDIKNYQKLVSIEVKLRQHSHSTVPWAWQNFINVIMQLFSRMDRKREYSSVSARKKLV